ncbi:MAG: DNA internalization-related competence protein ComEC/Rec2 [Candidatus Edwardsbacteria bacterium]
MPYLLGILIAHHFNIPTYFLFFLFPFACLCYILFKGEIFLLAILISFGIFNYQIRQKELPKHHLSNFLPLKKEVIIFGEIRNDPEIVGTKAIFDLEVKEISSQPYPFLPPMGEGKRERSCGKIRVNIKEKNNIYQYGDFLKIQGELRLPPAQRNPGGFDYRAYLKREGVYALLYLPSDESVQIIRRAGKNFFLTKVVFPIKHFVDQVFEETMAGPQKALLKGITLGQREDFPKPVLAAFSDTGVVHILAVSGFNVGLVALVFFLFLRFLRLPHQWAVWVTLLGLILYAFITDLTPSVVRATIMAFVFMISQTLEREVSLYHSLALSALIILLLWPQDFFYVGFQFSFAATLGIIALTPKIQKGLINQTSTFLKFPWLDKWVLLPFSVSLAAQLTTTPLVAFYFYKLPIISLLSNLIIIPLVGWATALGFATVLFRIFSLTLAGIFSAANWIPLTLILKTVEFSATVPYAYFRVPKPSYAFLIFYYLLLFLLANWQASRRFRRLFVFSLLCGLNIFVWQSVFAPRRLKVTFFAVGQGDAALLQFPDGKNLLIDAGQRTLTFDSGERIIAPSLWYWGISSFDGLIFSHPQIDHIGGAVYLLNHFKVKRVIDSGQIYPSQTYQEALQKIQDKKVEYCLARRGEKIQGFYPAEIFVLHPDSAWVKTHKVNNTSIVLKITYGKISFLFPGDIENEVEEELLKQGDLLEATVLKVPHHGSLTSFREEFIMKVKPKIAVISVGEFNRFGFPDSCVIEGYRKLGAEIYRTDESGAITIETDGERIWVKGMIP